jgi:linoleate 10R-lipoxygenase
MLTLPPKFYEVMQYFLRPENASIWTEIQGCAKKGDDKSIRDFVMEAQRMTSTQRTLRIATQATEVEGKSIKAGDLVIALIVSLQNSPVRQVW